MSSTCVIGDDDDSGDGIIKRRLQFPREKLYGREKELHRLLSIYGRLFVDGHGTRSKTSNTSTAADDDEIAKDASRRSSSSMAEMVLVSGYSGTGKSALVHQFRSLLAKSAVDAKRGTGSVSVGRAAGAHPRRNYRFISGAFEDKRTDPLSALSCAFESYCSQLVEEGDAEEIHRVTAGIKKVVGNEGKVLTDVIPGLTALIGEQPEASTSLSNEHSLNRLLFLFQSFVEIICRNNKKRPLILFLDDLQRADASSLDLLTALMTTDSECLGRNLMFVGALRSNEVDEDHPLSLSLDKIQKKRHKVNKSIERIRLCNLSSKVVNLFIAETLDLDPRKTEPLTDAVYGKTEGNIFYTMQSLEQLKEKEILTYDVLHSFRWVWDVNKIDQQLALSDNVVDIITARINKYPARLQKALMVAAFLRSTFDLWTIQEFMDTDYMQKACLLEQVRKESTYYYNDDNYDYDLVELLDLAVTDGLLKNEMGSTKYKFLHDRIQQAAYSLAPEEGSARDELQTLLGEYLLGCASSGTGEDWMWFVAADLLNSATTTTTTTTATSTTDSSATDLARLNLAVGERAVALSGFIPAAGYFRHGLAALEGSSSSPWRSRYELSLELHRSASDTELSVGDFDVGWRLAHTIFREARTFSDKMPTYLSLVDALGRRERSAEALGFIYEALEQLGECQHRKRRKLLPILKAAGRIKKAFRSATDDQIRALPMMSDPDKLSAVELLSKLVHSSYMCGDRPTAILSVLRLLELTFQFGVCGASAHAIAGYGVILIGAGKEDPEGCRRMGRLAKDVLHRIEGETFKARTLECAAAFIDAWFVPLTSVMESLYDAHALGMKTGDFEIGFRAFLDFQVIAYASGTTLSQIEKDGSRMRRLMEQYSVHQVLSLFREFRILVTSLTGTTEKDSKDWKDPCPSDQSPLVSTGVAWYYFSRMQLAYLFGEMPLADEMSTKVLGVVQSRIRPFTIVSHTLFFSALIAMEMFTKTRKRKYRTRANALRNKLKHLARTKGMNVLHKYLIVEAKYKATTAASSSRREKKKKDKEEDDIRNAFDNAISVASRTGFTQDAAIANELAADYFLRGSANRDYYWAKHYLTNAHQKYHDWGAHEKVRHLLGKHGHLIDKSGCLDSKTFQRKHVIRGDACDKHKAINLESLGSGYTTVAVDSLRELNNGSSIGF